MDADICSGSEQTCPADPDTKAGTCPFLSAGDPCTATGELGLLHFLSLAAPEGLQLRTISLSVCVVIVVPQLTLTQSILDTDCNCDCSMLHDSIHSRQTMFTATFETMWRVMLMTIWSQLQLWLQICVPSAPQKEQQTAQLQLPSPAHTYQQAQPVPTWLVRFVARLLQGGLQQCMTADPRLACLPHLSSLCCLLDIIHLLLRYHCNLCS